MIVGNKKSKKIRLTPFKNRELYLAFILGYYDGDGKVGSTVITGGSLCFIEEVKNYFNNPYKIWVTNSEWKEMGYNVYLGMKLMKYMLNNYENSLYRKRIHFDNHK